MREITLLCAATSPTVFFGWQARASRQKCRLGNRYPCHPGADQDERRYKGQEHRGMKAGETSGGELLFFLALRNDDPGRAGRCRCGEGRNRASVRHDECRRSDINALNRRSLRGLSADFALPETGGNRCSQDSWPAEHCELVWAGPTCKRCLRIGFHAHSAGLGQWPPGMVIGACCKLSASGTALSLTQAPGRLRCSPERPNNHLGCAGAEIAGNHWPLHG
jgi:hypothetical protein